MSEKSFLNENYLIWVLLNQTRAAVFKARELQIGKYPFPNQAAALIIIWSRDGKATPTLLSRYLFLERHSASELVSRMESNGLVTKKRDEKLKSVIRISLTPEGKKICAQNMGTRYIDEMMSALSEKERANLKKCLLTLLKTACDQIGTEAILPTVSR
jgi:MarR family transcriptional regulator, organic hydroperoxide resistance regulator